MKKRARLLAALLCLVMAVCALPALASSPEASYFFTLDSSYLEMSSGAAYKTNAGTTSGSKAYVSPESGNSNVTYLHYYFVKNDSGTAVTGQVGSRGLDDLSISYYSGQATNGYKTLCGLKGLTVPDTVTIQVDGVWNP